MEDIALVTIGHVDHGKSSVIGRLLADTDSLPKGKIESIKNMCLRQSKVFEYAYLLDALKDKQMQGITIDSARCFFKTKKRRILLKDAPGHLEFLKNMVTGASMVDAGFLVIDALEGMKENTRRHSYLLSILGIKQMVVLINKMDLVNYDYNRFIEIKKECEEYLASINVKSITYIPTSAQNGDNIAKKSEEMSWYDGNTVLEMIDKFEVAKPNKELEFRMPLQDVYKFTANKDTRRIFAGTVLSGKINIGDEVVFYPSKKKSKIKTIETYNTEAINSVVAGESTGFTLEDEIYIKRGEILTLANQKAPIVSDKIKVRLFWLGKEPIKINKRYYIKLGHSKIEAVVDKIDKVFDAENLIEIDSLESVEKNNIAEVVFSLKSNLAFDLDIFEASRLVVVDDYEISGGGIIIENVENDIKNKRIIPTVGKVSFEDRARLLSQKGKIIWLTGRSGAGKSTISIELEKRLFDEGKLVYRLDGDNVRSRLNKDLGFSEDDRRENIRRIAEVSRMFADAGVIVIVATISPLKELRELANEILSDKDYMNFYVNASLETCKKRDPKGLYKKYFNTQSTIDYQESENEVKIDTEKLSVGEAVEFILEKMEA